nr:MAG TPA: hypothetical protein [Caudoviricetes sp.]
MTTLVIPPSHASKVKHTRKERPAKGALLLYRKRRGPEKTGVPGKNRGASEKQGMPETRKEKGSRRHGP